MVRITVTARDSVDPVRLGVELLQTIRRRHPTELVLREEFLDKLAGTNALRLALRDGSMNAALNVLRRWQRDATRFDAATRVDRIYR